MVPNRKAGGMLHSASSSGMFFPADDQSQVLGNSILSSSFGNSSNLLPGNARANLAMISGDASNAILNSAGSSTPSVGASSFITDATSGLSGGHLQRSASTNAESHIRLPASPMSFSSNNIGVSGSPIMDGSSVIQSNSNQDPNSQQLQQCQPHQGPSSATSFLPSRVGQVQIPCVTRVPGPFIQEPSYISQLQKKPRLDIKQEDVIPQKVLHQILHRQDASHLQNSNPQLQALIQQQRLRQQQQQLLQSMPPLQRAQLLQQQQQLQIRQQLHLQGMQTASAMKRPFDGGVCSRRLMQYLYHQRQRPPDNSISYWRKFVAEYFSPRAKKRWCLSLYNNVGHQSVGVFPQASTDAWQCDICGSKSGRGFEATFEVLPRLNEIKFGSGVIDELLFLDLPRECRFPSGIMMLEYTNAVQESVYEQLRVVREGQLRIIFTADLKILSWEFCARRHEELLPRRLVAPQVNQLLQVAQKCQSTISEKGPDAVSHQDLQTNNNMVVTAGRQLARSLEFQSLNDLGFSKRFVRCLQISEVVNSMKELMDFSRDHKVGPIEGLKSFPRHAAAAKLQQQKRMEMDHLGGIQSLSANPSAFNKLSSLHPVPSSPIGSIQLMQGRGGHNGYAQAALTQRNDQNLFARQSSMNSNHSSVTQEASPSTDSSNPNPSATTFQGPVGIVSGNLQTSFNGLSGSHPQQQPPQSQQRLMSGDALLQQNNLQTSHGSPALQQQMIQQLMHQMAKHGESGMQQQYIVNQSTKGMVSRDVTDFESNSPAGGSTTTNGTAYNFAAAPSCSNSKVTHEPSVEGQINALNQKPAEQSKGSHLQDESIGNGFRGELYNSDVDDYMNFDWDGDDM